MKVTYAILACLTLLLGQGAATSEGAFFLLFAYGSVFLLSRGVRGLLLYFGSESFSTSRVFNFKFFGKRQKLVSGLLKVLILFLGLWVIFELLRFGYGGFNFFTASFAVPSLTFNERSLYMLGALVICFLSVFATKLAETKSADLLGTQEEDEFSENTYLIPWFRMFVYLAVINLALFFSGYLGNYLADNLRIYFFKFIDVIFWISLAGVLVVALEMVVALLKELPRLTKPVDKNFMCTGFFVMFFASKPRLLQSMNFVILDRFNIDLAKSEIMSYFMKILEPTLIGAVLLLWLFTTLVIVPLDKQAIIKTFGVIKKGHVANPGLHFKLPWPFAKVEFYSPRSIRSMNIGFIADDEQRNLIWSKQHSLTNENLIVGDGVEFINIDCQVLWRIKDLYKHVVNIQNPEELIEAWSYKLLTLATVSSTFDEIISRDRAILSNRLMEELQELADEAGLGVEIVDLIFLAIHPPLEVAKSFEDVISAQIEKLTYVLKAQSEREHKYRFYQADSHAIKQKAEMARIKTVQSAIGEAYSIKTKAMAFNAEPELETFRLRLENMQKLLSSKKVYIYDKSLMRRQDGMILNLTN
jgi:regulator of protease activity HflC (stomatin/prohibitin superfamily)